MLRLMRSLQEATAKPTLLPRLASAIVAALLITAPAHAATPQAGVSIYPISVAQGEFTLANVDNTLYLSDPSSDLSTVSMSGVVRRVLTTGPAFSPAIQGPDGRPWWTGMTELTAGGKTFIFPAIYELTQAGTEALVYQLPQESWYGAPRSVATGIDGIVWFDLSHFVPSPALGRFSRATSLGEVGIPGEWPGNVTAGPGDSMWFTQIFPPAVGRVDEATDTVMEWATHGIPQALVGGAEGTQWFATGYPHALGEITAAGVVSEYPLANAGDRIVLAAGPDGNIWFASDAAPMSSGAHLVIGRITPQGTITEYPILALSEITSPASMVLGPDGNLWLATINPDTLVRINPLLLASTPLPRLAHQATRRTRCHDVRALSQCARQGNILTPRDRGTRSH